MSSQTGISNSIGDPPMTYTTNSTDSSVWGIYTDNTGEMPSISTVPQLTINNGYSIGTSTNTNWYNQMHVGNTSPYEFPDVEELSGMRFSEIRVTKDGINATAVAPHRTSVNKLFDIAESGTAVIFKDVEGEHDWIVKIKQVEQMITGTINTVTIDMEIVSRYTDPRDIIRSKK